jgi:hypothetical protein
MGRSVMTYGENSIYLELSDEVEMQEYDWDFYYENLSDLICEKFKSMDCIVDDNKFYGNEGRVICENRFAEVIVCAYYNVVSVNLCVKDDAYEYNLENIAQAWCDRIENNFAKMLKDAGYNVLARQGTFSNGVSIYMSAA